jgi:hypothetical protein
MIVVQCDSCEKPLRNEPDQHGNEAEAHYTLEVKGTKGDKTIRPLFMDLCPRCVRFYLKTLRQPLVKE